MMGVTIICSMLLDSWLWIEKTMSPCVSLSKLVHVAVPLNGYGGGTLCSIGTL